MDELQPILRLLLQSQWNRRVRREVLCDDGSLYSVLKEGRNSSVTLI